MLISNDFCNSILLIHKDIENPFANFINHSMIQNV